MRDAFLEIYISRPSANASLSSSVHATTGDPRETRRISAKLLENRREPARPRGFGAIPKTLCGPNTFILAKRLKLSTAQHAALRSETAPSEGMGCLRLWYEKR